MTTETTTTPGLNQVSLSQKGIKCGSKRGFNGITVSYALPMKGNNPVTRVQCWNFPQPKIAMANL